MDDAQSPPDSGNGKGDRARRASLRLTDAESVAATRRNMFGDGSLLDALAGSLDSEQMRERDEPLPPPPPVSLSNGDGDAPALPQPVDPALGMPLEDLAQPLDAIIDSFPVDAPASVPGPNDRGAEPDLAPPDLSLLDGRGERAPVSSIFSGLGDVPSGEIGPPEPGAAPDDPPEPAGWPPFPDEPSQAADGAPAHAQAAVQPPIVPPDAPGRAAPPPAGTVRPFPAPPAWPPFPQAPGADDALPSFAEGSVPPPFIELPADGIPQPGSEELGQAPAAAAPVYPERAGWPPLFPGPLDAAEEPGHPAEPVRPPFMAPVDANEAPPFLASGGPAPLPARGAATADAPPFRATGAWPPFPQAPGADDGGMSASEATVPPPFIELPADDATDGPAYPRPAADNAAPSIPEPSTDMPDSFPEAAGRFSDPTELAPARALDAGGPRASLQAAAGASHAATAKIAAEATATAEALENLQRLLATDMPEHQTPEVQPQPGQPLRPGASWSHAAADPVPFGAATDLPQYLPLAVESPGDSRTNVYLLGFVTGLGLALAAGAALYFLINTG